MKAVVYCGTRNLYSDMVTAAKSLLIHSDVERVYFLIEDDDFPHPLPSCILTINVAGQTWFTPGGPNYWRKWTWMVLMRMALPKILDEDIVLSLDVDTIVEKDISALWDIDLAGYYVAAAREPLKSHDKLYVNCGVALFNLKLLRESGACDAMIEALNTREFTFAEQDAVAELWQGKIKTISAEYNNCDFTEYVAEERARIRHYAFNQSWRSLPEVRRYQMIPWEEICTT